MTGRRRRTALDWAGLCERAQRYPGVETGTSNGTPALKVAGKLLARLQEDGKNARSPM